MGNLRTFNALASPVLSVKPYCLFTIELHFYGRELLCLSRKFRDYSLNFVEAVGRAGGPILGWRMSLKVYIVSSSLHHISFRVCKWLVWLSGLLLAFMGGILWRISGCPGSC